MKRQHLSRLTLTMLAVSLSSLASAATWQYHQPTNGAEPTKRHETGGLVIGNNFYLIGGRGALKPHECLDDVSGNWQTKTKAPIELNHFQPVEWGGKIWVIGAFNGPYPDENIVGDIYSYDIANDTWQVEGTIPTARQRGSTGAVVYNNKIYIVGGNTNGHRNDENGGSVAWLDEYNPATGEWKTLSDAPHARDHFAAAVVGNKLVVAAGRRSAYPQTNFDMEAATDVYNLSTGKWETGYADIPTKRAGTAAVSYESEVIVLGGETTQYDAEATVEALNVNTKSWRALPDMNIPRHGLAAGVIGDTLYAVAGAKTRGGAYEVDANITETLLLSDDGGSTDSDGDGLSNDAETTQYNTDPNDADSDNDGINDGDEVNTLGTDPLKADSDGDGLKDNAELNRGTDPLVADSDGDGLNDGPEVNQHGSDPLLSDTDGDGLDDYDEVNTHGTDPNAADSDADGLSDPDEINTHGTDPMLADSDADGLSDGDELTLTTDPNIADSDADGANDGDEVTDGTDPLAADSDSDGLDDGAEKTAGTDPLDADTDSDSVDDAAEIDAGTDPLDASDYPEASGGGSSETGGSGGETTEPGTGSGTGSGSTGNQDEEKKGGAAFLFGLLGLPWIWRRRHHHKM